MIDFYSEKEIVFYLSEIKKWKKGTFSSNLEKEITFLCKVLDFLNYFYYIDSKPLVADDLYDSLFNRLKRIDIENVHKVPAYAPIFRVGSSIVGDRETFKHEVPMISLNNSKELEGLAKFNERVEKSVGKGFSLIGELKLDGVGFSLKYEGGFLKRALSRGDGSIGEDITANVKTIKNVPLKIKTKKPVLVRGEIVIKNSFFKKMNEKRASLGKKIRSNPRNTVAGALRTKDPSHTEKIPLFAFFYDIPIFGAEVLSTHSESMDILKKMGFYVDSSRVLGSRDNIKEYYKKILKIRSEIDVDCDGVVVKVNEKKYRDILGSTSHHPRWALALKFPANKTLTEIQNVEWQLGRTGTLTPVAKLKPIDLGGVKVSNASLHNYSLFKSLNLAPGDTVEVQRAGDVIPQVVGKVVSSGNDFFKYPKVWNGSDTRIDENGVFLYCEDPNEDLINFEKFKYFVSKSGLDIEGVSEKTIKLLIEKKWVRSFSDFFLLEKHEEEWKNLENWGDVSVQNILSGIKESVRNANCSKILTSLGIPLVGSEISKLLLQNFDHSIEKLFNVGLSDLLAIKGIGLQTAKNIVKNFSNPEFLKELSRMQECGLPLSEKSTEGVLSGLSIVVTGKLTKSRAEMKKFVEKEGGNFSSGISSKVDYLIKGVGGGSKEKKAIALGVEIISEDDFYSMFL